MSEKIYAFLLRFFPGHFRQVYGDDALQLFRDRFRDERGFFQRLRLWLDLLRDLAISIPREYGQVRSAIAAAPVPQRLDEILLFRVLQGEPPRPEAIFFGSLLSLAAVGAFAIAIGHAGDYRPFRAFVAPLRHSPHLRPSAFSHSASSRLDDGNEEAIGSANEARANAPSPPPETLKHEKAQDASKQAALVATDSAEIDAAERQRVINAAAANLKQHYVAPEIAQKMADILLAHAKDGDDDAVQTGAGLAVLLTRQMRDVSHDMRLEVVYSHAVLPDRAMGMTAEELARYRTALEHLNCTFEKLENLPHNIGYFKLNSFPDPSICGAKATGAMASLNHADCDHL